jgi:hypothetical protein
MDLKQYSIATRAQRDGEIRRVMETRVSQQADTWFLSSAGDGFHAQQPQRLAVIDLETGLPSTIATRQTYPLVGVSVLTFPFGRSLG